MIIRHFKFFLVSLLFLFNSIVFAQHSEENSTDQHPSETEADSAKAFNAGEIPEMMAMITTRIPGIRKQPVHRRQARRELGRSPASPAGGALHEPATEAAGREPASYRHRPRMAG